ncbi:MAG: hypothetical protein P4M00_08820 [Azospirillaceae bacterium]|nr:hypothetical protein [Azospirillaceae bacterium]
MARVPGKAWLIVMLLPILLAACSTYDGVTGLQTHNSPTPIDNPFNPPGPTAPALLDPGASPALNQAPRDRHSEGEAVAAARTTAGSQSAGRVGAAVLAVPAAPAATGPGPECQGACANTASRCTTACEQAGKSCQVETQRQQRQRQVQFDLVGATPTASTAAAPGPDQSVIDLLCDQSACVAACHLNRSQCNAGCAG